MIVALAGGLPHLERPLKPTPSYWGRIGRPCHRASYLMIVPTYRRRIMCRLSLVQPRPSTCPSLLCAVPPSIPYYCLIAASATTVPSRLSVQSIYSFLLLHPLIFSTSFRRFLPIRSSSARSVCSGSRLPGLLRLV